MGFWEAQNFLDALIWRDGDVTKMGLVDNIWELGNINWYPSSVWADWD